MPSDFYCHRFLTIRIIPVFVMICFLVSGASADRLVLDSGDSLSGKLKSLKDGKLVWINPVLGELKINQANVSAVQTDTNFDLQTDFGLLQSCLLVADAQRQLLECDSKKLALDSWSAVSALAVKIDPEAVVKEKVEKSGEVKLALEDTSGNSDKQNYDIDASLVVKHKKMRHTFGFELENDQSNDVKTKDEWELNYVYDHFMTDQWFISSNVSYEEDEFKNLDHKISFGLGAGYQFFENSTSSLSSTMGLNYVEEEKTDGDKNDSSALRVTVDYRWKPFEGEGGMEFYHKNELINAFSGTSYYTFESLTGVNFPINGRLHSVLEYDYDYNSEPAVGTGSSDRKWSVGLRYKW